MEQNKQDPANELIANVKNGMILFTVVIKNQALYPDTNKIWRDSMGRLRQWLEAFLAAENSLCLTVKQNRLLYQDEVVFQDRPNEHALIFPLHRDGVKWFEFTEGLTLKELRTFIDLLNRFRVLKEEDEDDLVTAMWEKEFVNIKYKTADDFWGHDGDSLISPQNVRDILSETEAGDQGAGSPAERPQTKPVSELFEADFSPAEQSASRSADSDDGSGGSTSAVSVLERDFGHVSWNLSPEESEYLRSVIAQDQFRYSSHDSLDIILVLLRGIEGEHDVAPILDFMTDAVKNLLAQSEISRTREYLEKLQLLTNGGKPWINTLVAGFHKRIAAEEVMSLLIPSEPLDPATSTAFYNDLYRLLLYLSPESVYALAALTAKVEDPYLEKIFLTVLAVKAGQADQASIPVANALGKLRPASLVELTNLIRGHRLPWPTGFLEMLSRHEAPQVREMGLLIMLEQDTENLGKLAHMLKDPNPGINQIVCAQLSRTRSAASEKILIDHLSNLYEQGQPQSKEQLLNCYRALGHCATAQVLPFLQNILLKGGWRTMIGQHDELHRQGAALALMILPEAWGTAEVLKKAAKSPFKAIRQACQNAEAELTGAANA